MNNNIFKANMARTMHFVMHFKASDDRNRENTAPHGDVAESYILYVAANTVKRIFGIKDFNIHKFFLGIFDSNIFIQNIVNISAIRIVYRQNTSGLIPLIFAMNDVTVGKNNIRDFVAT